MLALVLLIILGIDWASGYAIAGYCMTHGVNPYGYAFWQSFGPFSLLLVLQLVRREVWLGPKGAAYAVLCGIFGIVIPNLLIYLVARYIPSGMLTVLANTSPLFTYVLALMFGTEKFNLARMLWVILGLIGLGLILFPGNLAGLDFNAIHGWMYVAILIPLSYAFCAVYIARFHPGRGNVLSHALWMLMVASLCISPLTVIQGGYYPLKLSDLNSGLIGLEIILSTFGYIILFILIRRVGAVYYSLVNAIAALTGLAYGHFLFGQSVSRLSYLALAIVLLTIFGLTVSQVRQQRQKDVEI